MRPVHDDCRRTGECSHPRRSEARTIDPASVVKSLQPVTDGAGMNLIWRFYMDQDRQWRWQRLSVWQAVVAESPGSYKEYEGCVANAEVQGYVFQPPQTTRIQPRATSRKRS